MSVIFRCRVEPDKLAKADKVTSELGTSVAEVVRIFLTEIARTGKVPVNLNTRREPEDILLNREARNKLWRELDDAEGW